MAEHNYPDNLYADALLGPRQGVQGVPGTPTGAYRSTDPETPEAERKLRTALAYVCHARDLINDALAIQTTALKGQTQPTRCDPERVPKWDPAWGKPPNCDGLSARDVSSPHPMQAGAIRDHDERLSGAEDRL
jgi:hypothetical protein